MRRIALACIAAAVMAFAPVLASAQGAASSLPIGIWAGVTSATFRGNDAVGPTYLTGFSAGVFTQWHFAPHWALQPEIEYSQKGSDEVSLAQGGGAYSMHIRLDYLEIPVLLRAEAPAIGPLTPFAVIGPEVEFKLGCGLVLTGLQGNFTCASLPAAESVDYGGVAGAGVSFRIGGRTFGLSARYDAGVANAFAANDAKNRAVTVLLGTVFR